MSVRVSLGNVIRHRSEFIEIDDFEVYKRCRVQVNTKGIILRDKVKGIEIKTKRQQVCNAGEFLVAEIDAKMGGFGIVPPELDGAIVSSHYFLYEVDESVLDAKYLGFYIRTSDFIDQVQAQGSTNYAAIRPHDVLEYTIPLPPLEEQRRIVAHIEALATKIEEAQELRERANGEFEYLLGSELNKFIKDEFKKESEFRQIGDFTIFDRYGPRFYNESYSSDGIPIMRATDIHESGKVNYKSMPKMLVTNTDINKLTLKKGDLVVVRSGSVGLAAVFDRDDFNCIPAAYLIQFRFDSSVIPEYVRYCLQVPTIKLELSGRGTALKNVNSSKIKSISVPTPSVENQKAIVAYFDDLQNQIYQAKQNRKKIYEDCALLLPSILDKAFKGEL